jgi:hypothetical protein
VPSHRGPHSRGSECFMRKQIVTERFNGDTGSRGEGGWIVEDAEPRSPLAPPWVWDVKTTILDSNWDGEVVVGRAVIRDGNFEDGRARFK